MAKIRVIYNSMSFFLAFSIGTAISFWSFNVSQAEDMGFFLSLSKEISKGESLYSGIWEIKDPLFLWTIGLANALLGNYGPYIVDGVAIALSTLFAFKLLYKFSKNKLISMLFATIFTLSYSGIYYQPLRSGTIAMLIYLLLLNSLASRNLLSSGILIALLLGFKFAYAPVALAAFPIIFFDKKLKQNILKSGIGFSLATSLLGGALLFRGELDGYFAMQKTNFQYRETYQEIVGLPQGIKGHFEIANSYGLNLIILTIIWLLFTLFSINIVRREDRLFSYVASCGNLGVLIIFFLSAMWPHHLQLVSIFVLGILIQALLIIVDVGHSLNWTIKNISIGILILILFLNQTRFFDFSNRLYFPNDLNKFNSLTEPPEVDEVILKSSTLDHVRYARLGINDDLGLAAFLPDNFEFTCKFFGQFGIETRQQIDQLINCLQSDANLVLVSPGFKTLERPTGDFNRFRDLLYQFVHLDFDCSDLLSRPGAEVCIKLNK